MKIMLLAPVGAGVGGGVVAAVAPGLPSIGTYAGTAGVPVHIQIHQIHKMLRLFGRMPLK